MCYSIMMESLRPAPTDADTLTPQQAISGIVRVFGMLNHPRRELPRNVVPFVPRPLQQLEPGFDVHWSSMALKDSGLVYLGHASTLYADELSADANPSDHYPVWYMPGPSVAPSPYYYRLYPDPAAVYEGQESRLKIGPDISPRFWERFVLLAHAITDSQVQSSPENSNP